MKRFISLMMVLMIVVGTLAVGVAAATKADLLSEAAKSPIYKYVKVAVENAARTAEITDEQAEKLLPIVKKAVAAVSADKGPTAKNVNAIYTDAEINAVLGCIDEACDVLGYSYKFIPSTNPKHATDHVFMVYDNNGKLIFQYDGDVVADTDAATDMDTTALFIGGALLLVAGVAGIVVSKKRMAA